MTAPPWFTEALARRFGSRLRIRWSAKLGEWQVEQQVGRAAFAPNGLDPHDDAHIRAKDGYALVLSIRPAPTAPCPDCGTPMNVPIMRFGEAVCSRCKAEGGDGRHAMSYWPLNERLLTHLLRIDPERADLQALAREVDEANHRMLQERERDFSNRNQAIASDYFNHIFEIPQVGYTGREHAWEGSSA